MSNTLTEPFRGCKMFHNHRVHNTVVETGGRLLLTIREAATALSICERTLWQLTKDGEIPSVRFGRNVRYNLATLEEWVSKRERMGAAPGQMRSKERVSVGLETGEWRSSSSAPTSNDVRPGSVSSRDERWRPGEA